MRVCASGELVRATVHRVLSDEVAHSRLGWAHLASSQGDLCWLVPYLEPMLRDAIAAKPVRLTNSSRAPTASCRAIALD